MQLPDNVTRLNVELLCCVCYKNKEISVDYGKLKFFLYPSPTRRNDSTIIHVLRFSFISNIGFLYTTRRIELLIFRDFYQLAGRFIRAPVFTLAWRTSRAKRSDPRS